MPRVTVVVVVFALAACGTTNADGIASVSAEINATRARWAALPATLPPPGTLPPFDPSTLSPPLAYDETDVDARNAEVVMLDQLSDPDTVSSDPSRVDLILSGRLRTCVMWTGPRNPMARSAMYDRRGDELAAECRASAAWPYLLVLRPITYARPLAMDQATYTPGDLALEAVLVDTRTWTPRGAVVVHGQSAPVVTFTTRSTDTVVEAQQSMEQSAYSTLWSSTRVALAAALTRGASRFVAD